MMEHSFTIKSYRNGLALYMKPDVDFETLLSDVAEKFYESRQFFGNAQMALSLSGREFTNEEEILLIETIEANSELKIVCLIGQDEKIEYMFRAAAGGEEGGKGTDNVTDSQFYRGTLKKGQSLETEHSIIILGDVRPGAKVYSKRDIIILGSFLGEAHAGIDEMPGHFVAALEFSPQSLKIGACQYKKKSDKFLWPDSYKNLPKIAAPDGDKIVVKPITKELLGKITVDEPNKK